MLSKTSVEPIRALPDDPKGLGDAKHDFASAIDLERELCSAGIITIVRSVKLVNEEEGKDPNNGLLFLISDGSIIFYF
jgi:hypothetical protein